MIALPLVWDESGRYTACGRYKVNVMRGRVTKYVGLAYGFISEKVEDIDAAQAACERHHQMSVAKMLTPWALDTLEFVAREQGQCEAALALAEASRAQQEPGNDR